MIVAFPPFALLEGTRKIQSWISFSDGLVHQWNQQSVRKILTTLFSHLLISSLLLIKMAKIGYQGTR